MDRAIETWLTRFAAGAGTLYEWQVNREGALQALTAGTRRHDMCPLSAAYTLEHGPVASFADAGKTLGYFGLTFGQGSAIIRAADNRDLDPERQAIRARLLRICGIEALTEKETPRHD